METKFLIFSSNLLSKKATDALFSFNKNYDNINKKYERTEQSFLIVAYNNEDDVNTVMRRINFKFKKGTLLFLDTETKECNLYKYNLTTGIEEENEFLSIDRAKEMLFPTIEYMYYMLTNKELGYIKCIDKRDPAMIEDLFENICKN